MQSMKIIFLGILLLTIFSIGGTAVGFVIGWNIDFPSSAFTQWRKFPTTSIKFSKIVYVNPSEVWAQSIDGKLYYSCSTRDSVTATCNWGETENIPDDIYKTYFKIMSKGCPDSSANPKKAPGEIVECASTVGMNPGGAFIMYFALLEDGTIWQWIPPSHTDVPMMSFCICPSIGFVMGFGASIFLIYCWAGKKK